MKQEITFVSSFIILLVIPDLALGQRNGIPRDSRKSSSRKPKLQTNHMSWTTTLPDGRVIDETVKIIPSQKKMYIRSKRVPVGSGFSNSSTLIYFNKNQLIVKFYFKSSLNGKLQEACFVSAPDTDYDTTRQEIQRRATSAVPIPSSTTYRKMVASTRVDTSALKRMGKSVFVFCRKAAAKGHVFNLLKADSNLPIRSTIDGINSTASLPTQFKASGLVSPMRRSTSVPFLAEVKQDSLVFH